MRNINKEFAELMMTKTEGRMIEQLTVSFSASGRATCFLHAQYMYTRICNHRIHTLPVCNMHMYVLKLN